MNDTNIITEKMNIVFVGHVDHGKSTIIGRLLVDTDSLPEGKLEQVKNNCEINSKPFEYAFLIDALKDEQSQGITIDSARVFFKTNKRHYIIIDAPGHIEFLKNMITGASRAEAALLVIDADEGVQENSRRHCYMLSMLGIKQVAVLINKMDLVSYKQKVFEDIKNEYSKFLKEININPYCYIPVSGVYGDNIVFLSKNMKWYNGNTVLNVLDVLEKEKPNLNKQFRMPVQDVYKFTNFGDSRRIIVGSIETGKLKVGDELIFYPSGKKSMVKTIETFNGKVKNFESAQNTVGFTLTEQIYITRGEIATKKDEPRPKVTTRIKVSLFWLGKEAMIPKKEYLFKLGTVKVHAKIEEVLRVINASTLQSTTEKNMLERHDVADCILKLDKAIAFDLTKDIMNTSRFVIVDDYEIAGGGVIVENLTDKQSWVRDKVFLRHYKWEKSIISQNQRAEKYNQKPSLILITGQKDVGKKRVAKTLEKRLFRDGKLVYFLGIGNILYGVDADIKGKLNNNHHDEHVRRISELANILLDAGMILILTAIEITQDDLEIIKNAIGSENLETIWIGENITTDIICDLHIPNMNSIEEASEIIRASLQNKGIIFKPW